LNDPTKAVVADTIPTRGAFVALDGALFVPSDASIAIDGAIRGKSDAIVAFDDATTGRIDATSDLDDSLGGKSDATNGFDDHSVDRVVRRSTSMPPSSGRGMHRSLSKPSKLAYGR
jgi:hypothetical protein